VSDEVEDALSRASAQGVDINWVRGQLDEIRESGYLLAPVGERTADVGGLGSDFDSKSIKATLTVAGPGDRWTRIKMGAPCLWSRRL
jgi:hypothetical protein